jgi:predicted murein hydrolase (TIGR00659 family)
MTRFADIWAYLGATPLLWLTATVLVYAGALAAYRRAGQLPWLNPVILSIAVLVAILLLTGTSYGTYFEGAQFLHFLLGPATVALAVPLRANAQAVRRALLPMAAALLAASLTAVVSVVGVAMLLGASRTTLLSLAPKSVTSPIAMGIAEQIGGLPSLTAALVMLTGLIGGLAATPIYERLGIRDYRARGFATGIAAHGMGIARAFQVHPVAGVFAGIGMALNGLVTAILVPLLAGLVPL